MTCYRLSKAFLSSPDSRGNTGRPNFVPRGFDYPVGVPPERCLLLPCGKCIGCRLDYTKSWAARCAHESSLYDNGLANSFVTLTYDDAHLPYGNTLVKNDVQLFLKRLRKSRPDTCIRYFGCGEYGPEHYRPHYHMILFNCVFPDKVLWRQISKSRSYISDELASIWGKGFVNIGDVTLASAAYVARYVTKKVTSDMTYYAPYIYTDYNGEIVNVIGEFTFMSRMNGGIGHDWYSKYKHSIYERGYLVVTDDFKCRIPAYYNKCYKLEHPDLFEAFKVKCRDKASEVALSPDSTTERLIEREKCKLLEIQKYIRSL